MQVQKGQQNKNGRTKIGGTKKLVGTFGHWVAGTPSASAKRSVEQKMVEQKFSGDPQPLGVWATSASAERSAEQKMAEQKIWWGPMAEQKMVGALGHWLAGRIPITSAKRSAEQKMAEQKFGVDPRPLGGGDP